MSVCLRVVTSSSGLHSKRCLGIGTCLDWTGKSVSFRMWHDPRGFSSFNVRPSSSSGGLEGQDLFPDKAGESTVMSR